MIDGTAILMGIFIGIIIVSLVPVIYISIKECLKK
jgi:hypothetical protein